MKKQYHISYAGSFRANIALYHDGAQTHIVTLWDDDVDDSIEKLEKDGYTRGFTKEEVEQARKEYGYLRDNCIEGE